MWSDEARQAAAEARRGTHSSGIEVRVPDKFAARLHMAYFGRTAAGQRNETVGNVWQKVGKTSKSRARAETIAKGLRIDHPDRLVRVR